jgi:hypothetical protein
VTRRYEVGERVIVQASPRHVPWRATILGGGPAVYRVRPDDRSDDHEPVFWTYIKPLSAVDRLAELLETPATSDRRVS